jgi:hypothetical protein
MATPQDADLILKLYQLRTEETMRNARKFLYFEFYPQSSKDVEALFADQEHPEYNHYFRQVTSYWDMASAMVNHGAIDKALFFDTNGEPIAVWAKLGEHIEDLRKFLGPNFLGNLEKLVLQYPSAEVRIQMMRERYKKMAAIRGK